MGKRLIIRGADFSENGIAPVKTWIQTSDVTDGASLSDSGKMAALGLVLSSALNQNINLIRLRFRDTYDFTGKTYSLLMVESGVTTQNSTPQIIQDFTISAEENASGIKEIILDQPVKITSNTKTIAVGYANNESGASIDIPVAYSTTASYKNVIRLSGSGHSPADVVTNIGLGMDLGYID